MCVIENVTSVVHATIDNLSLEPAYNVRLLLCPFFPFSSHSYQWFLHKYWYGIYQLRHELKLSLLDNLGNCGECPHSSSSTEMMPISSPVKMEQAFWSCSLWVNKVQLPSVVLLGYPFINQHHMAATLHPCDSSNLFIIDALLHTSAPSVKNYEQRLTMVVFYFLLGTFCWQSLLFLQCSYS